MFICKNFKNLDFEANSATFKNAPVLDFRALCTYAMLSIKKNTEFRKDQAGQILFNPFYQKFPT